MKYEDIVVLFFFANIYIRTVAKFIVPSWRKVDVSHIWHIGLSTDQEDCYHQEDRTVGTHAHPRPHAPTKRASVHNTTRTVQAKQIFSTRFLVTIYFPRRKHQVIHTFYIISYIVYVKRAGKNNIGVNSDG
jgi:hypothetical protein